MNTLNKDWNKGQMKKLTLHAHNNSKRLVSSLSSERTYWPLKFWAAQRSLMREIAILWWFHLVTSFCGLNGCFSKWDWLVWINGSSFRKCGSPDPTSHYKSKTSRGLNSAIWLPLRSTSHQTHPVGSQIRHRRRYHRTCWHLLKSVFQ